MMQRQVLRLNAANAASAAGDTGPPFFGEIRQMRWVPTVGDSGGGLMLSLLPAAGDTAGGWTFYNDEDCLGAQFTMQPVVPQQAGDGFDTGVDQYAPVVSAGDRIRAKTAPAGNGAVSGLLYIWTFTP